MGGGALCVQANDDNNRGPPQQMPKEKARKIIGYMDGIELTKVLGNGAEGIVYQGINKEKLGVVVKVSKNQSSDQNI
jgi:hypothetical protein